MAVSTGLSPGALDGEVMIGMLSDELTRSLVFGIDATPSRTDTLDEASRGGLHPFAGKFTPSRKSYMKGWDRRASGSLAGGVTSHFGGRAGSDRGRALLGAEYRPQPTLAHFSNLRNPEPDPLAGCSENVGLQYRPLTGQLVIDLSSTRVIS